MTTLRRQQGLTLIELLLVLAVVVAIVGLVSMSASVTSSNTQVAGFESQAIQLRDAIERQYAQEPDLTTITLARLWNNQVIPIAIRGPNAVAALRGPYEGLMALSHVTLPGETRPTILRFSFALTREPSASALRDSCRRWVRALMPHFPYLALNRTLIALPRAGTHDVFTAAEIEATVASECADPELSPTVHYGMLL